MKKLLNNYSVGFVIACSVMVSSCNLLDENNPSALTLETAYDTKSGYEGLINACYTDMYYFYGKVDFIGPSEMGTDLWVNYGSNDSGLCLYDQTLTTQYGTIKTVWGGLYSMINLCNTAIYYADKVEGYASEQDVKSKVAEAYFMRAFANFNLVEQFGNVVLSTQSSVVSTSDNTPQRNTEEEFYELIISDLKFACANLPLTQQLRGRVSRKAAYGLLAKAYLQRTRLGNTTENARLALEAAEELINNQGTYKCSLYLSDATESGYSKLWDGKNNKSNTESLFLQAIDATAGLNPEGYNRGRTRQYYLPDLGGKGADFGAIERNILYGRSNAKQYKPSKYLLTTIFDPSETTPDTRFAETFTYKFYASTEKTITQQIADTYGKDASVVGHKVLNTAAAYSGPNYFLAAGATLEEQQNMTADEGLAVFTPNWNIDPDVKKVTPALVVDPSDLFDPVTGNYKTPTAGVTDLTGVFPAFRKYSSMMYVYTNQYWMGDIPIIRLGEIYLIAAEAALLYNNDQTKAADYVNVIRKRAALTTRESEMLVDPADVTVDFILQERARELAGEHTRWIDLKRTGNLSKTYLQATNPIVSVNFDPTKNTVRPIPQSFLDAIVNANEFGTNGY